LVALGLWTSAVGKVRLPNLVQVACASAGGGETTRSPAAFVRRPNATESPVEQIHRHADRAARVFFFIAGGVSVKLPPCSPLPASGTELGAS
jgi:hypothetical protein